MAGVGGECPPRQMGGLPNYDEIYHREFIKKLQEKLDAKKPTVWEERQKRLEIWIWEQVIRDRAQSADNCPWLLPPIEEQINRFEQGEFPPWVTDPPVPPLTLEQKRQLDRHLVDLGILPPLPHPAQAPFSPEELGRLINLGYLLPPFPSPDAPPEYELPDWYEKILTSPLPPDGSPAYDLPYWLDQLLGGATPSYTILDPELPNWLHSLCGGSDPECEKPPFGGGFKDPSGPVPRRDPLILDLDGDGVKTTNVTGRAYFDHNGDGFAEQTAWVDPHDGLLVMDRNGDGIINDGRELFGNQTVLRSGKTASNGFEALAGLDVNADDKIDPADPAFSQLRVWQDSDADGFSFFSELHTLDELGIKSINLDWTPDSTTDPQGNAQTRLGSLEKADGTSGQIAEYSLQRDAMDTIPEGWLVVPEDIAALPDLRGFGTVTYLHQAMVSDESGELKSFVQQFATAADPHSRNPVMNEILFKWSGTESIEPTARGPNVDARELGVLEKVFGKTYVGTNGPNPTYEAAVLLNESYREVFEFMYANLMTQTHLKDLYGKITYAWDEQKQEYATDMSEVIAELQMQVANNPNEGRELLSEFARSLRGLGHDRVSCLPCRELFIEMDPSLAWVIDTGGLPVYEHVGQGIRPWSPHIEGTDNADAIRGSRTEGDGYLNGLAGNDVIYGTTLPETLINESGDALLVGGGGGDIVWAGAGNDIVDGGPDNDLLFGEAGNDTYIFRRGSGQDTISDYDATPNNMDTIWLGSNLTPEDIILKRLGYNLVLKIEDTSDTLTVRGFFSPESSVNRVERIQFMDGTVWTDSDIIREVYAPTDGDDTIYGGIENDNLNSLGGNDTIYGRGGDDTLEGGTGNDKLYGEEGNDTLQGGEGNDTLLGGPGDDVLQGGPANDLLDGGAGSDRYLFSRGSGQDTINDRDTAPGANDAILLGEGILPADVKLERMGNDLKLTINDTGDSVTVKNWLQNDTPTYGIEQITFADTTIWGSTEIASALLTGTDGDDLIYGFSIADTMEGMGGDDTLYGHAGDDTIDGGTGNDSLYGEAGNDTLRGGEGTDTLLGGTGDDTVDGGAGNDTLLGGSQSSYSAFRDNANGNDTYLFGRGSGQDTVVDHDNTPGNCDTIRLADDVTPDDITLHRKGDNLELSINGAPDKLIVENWFWNDSPEYKVEQIVFTDGAIWDVHTIQQTILQGTSGDDVLVGYSTSDTLQGYDGNDLLYARGGDDTLHGGTGSDILYGEAGNDTLRGGDGDDTLVGGIGDDIVDSGAGNDLVYGGNETYSYRTAGPNGNDTFLFGRGSGQDTLIDRDATPGNSDTIRLADDLTPDDITLHRNRDDLELSITGASDKLTVQNWFWRESNEYQVERIQFAGGAVWDVGTIRQMALEGTSGDDLLVGYSTSDDTIRGYGGNDWLYGRGGDDTLDGGTGSDTLYGEPGNDTYIFGPGSGQDTVRDDDKTAGNLDTIQLTADALPADLGICREGDNLVLSIQDTPDTLTVENWFKDESNEWQVEEIRFADGTTWDVDTIKQMALQGTSGDDVLLGYSGSDTIHGFAGNDRLYGQDGGDTLDGGAGNDYLEGGRGADTYLFGTGSGQDIIVDYDNTQGPIDTVMLAAGVQPSDITLKRGGNDLFISINGTDDRLQLTDWFSDDAHKIERLQFSDGTVWDAAYMHEMTSAPTDTDDYLIGTPANDAIDGGGGNDTIYGREGGDTLYGGSGSDALYGEEGNDGLHGGSEDDTLYGSWGDDTLFGDEGDDRLFAGEGNNTLDGGPGNDRLEGGSGTNVLEGGPGDDTIVADQGKNTILVNRGGGFDEVISHFMGDETETAAVMVKDINPGDAGGAYEYYFYPTDVDGTLFFSGNDGSHGYELWKSDGTEAGTVMVKDVCPGSDGCWYGNPANVNGTLFFAADDGAHGPELWKSDGTEAGTVMVKDIVSPGFWVGDGYVDGSEPSELTNVNGTLFFIARDQAHGHELWKSDGTEAGTVLVKDILPGSWYSWPGNLTNVNGALFFTADDGAHGPELWKSDGNSGSTAPDGKPDTIIFGPGITPEDLRVQMQVGSTDGVYGMKLAIGIGENEGPVIQAGRGATGSDPSDLAIRRFVLADGTVLTLGDILARGDGVVGYQEGTYGDDTLRGSVTNDEIYGFAGNDESYGGAGDRILDGTRQLFLDKTAILPVINYLGELGFAASLFLSFGASTHGPPSPAQHALPALSRVACSTGKTRGRFTQYRNTVGS